MQTVCYSSQLGQPRHDRCTPRHRAQCLYPHRLTIALPLLLFFLALLSRDTQAAEAGHPDEIILGMSTALTGNAANLGKDMQRGILAGLEGANRSGGVDGRRLRLVALDDG